MLEADLVVLGPGSLYSSVLAEPARGGDGAEALSGPRATRVRVANLFTQPGETDGYDVADHVCAIQRHLGDVVDVVLLHERPLPAEMVAHEAARGSRPVHAGPGRLEARGRCWCVRDLVSSGAGPARPGEGPRALARHGAGVRERAGCSGAEPDLDPGREPVRRRLPYRVEAWDGRAAFAALR